MPKVRVCFEVQSIAVDEQGKPAPAGMQLTLGEVSEEKYASVDYFKAMQGVKALHLLNELGLHHLADAHAEADFRLISPEEYDKKYGGHP